MTPTKPTRLRARTLYLLRKRRDWRKRALAATVSASSWPSGKPGLEDVKTEAIKSQQKVRDWYRGGRAELVLSAIYRRALAAFRAQFLERSP